MQHQSYHHLKSMDMIVPYERRPSPLKEPRYSLWQKDLIWGCDWTKLLIDYSRWYLIILLDFFSRYLVAFDTYPSINASHVKHVYTERLKAQKDTAGEYVARTEDGPAIAKDLLGNEGVLLPHAGRLGLYQSQKTYRQRTHREVLRHRQGGGNPYYRQLSR